MLIYLDVKITGEPRRVNGSSRACVAQWRAERPDLDASSMVVMGRLQEAALVIARDRLNPLFARYGMQPGEFDVLATLRRGGAPFALTPTALYDALMMSSGGMTARIDRLQKAGWVERRPNPADGRGTPRRADGCGPRADR